MIRRRFRSGLCDRIGNDAQSESLSTFRRPGPPGRPQGEPGHVQLTLTATTGGLAIGQFVTGPLSDVVGRRGPLLLATALHVVASIGVAVAPDITWVLVCRVLRGMGRPGERW